VDVDAARVGQEGGAGAGGEGLTGQALSGKWQVLTPAFLFLVEVLGKVRGTGQSGLRKHLNADTVYNQTRRSNYPDLSQCPAQKARQVIQGDR
jgi:hypothetical protein